MNCEKIAPLTELCYEQSRERFIIFILDKKIEIPLDVMKALYNYFKNYDDFDTIIYQLADTW